MFVKLNLINNGKSTQVAAKLASFSPVSRQEKCDRLIKQKNWAKPGPIQDIYNICKERLAGIQKQHPVEASWITPRVYYQIERVLDDVFDAKTQFEMYETRLGKIAKDLAALEDYFDFGLDKDFFAYIEGVNSDHHEMALKIDMGFNTSSFQRDFPGKAADLAIELIAIQWLLSNALEMVGYISLESISDIKTYVRDISVHSLSNPFMEGAAASSAEAFDFIAFNFEHPTEESMELTALQLVHETEHIKFDVILSPFVNFGFFHRGGMDGYYRLRLEKTLPTLKELSDLDYPWGLFTEISAYLTELRFADLTLKRIEEKGMSELIEVFQTIKDDYSQVLGELFFAVKRGVALTDLGRKFVDLKEQEFNSLRN